MLKNNIGRILGYVFLAFLVYYLYSNQELLEPLKSISLLSIIGISILKITLLLANGLFTKITLEAFEIKISHRESAYISLLSSLGNYFGPLLGGMGVRAGYLKKKYGLALTHFAGTIYGYYLITFFSIALIGLLSTAAIYYQSSSSSFLVTLSLLTVFATTGLLMLLRVKINSQTNNNKTIIDKIRKRVSQVNEGWLILSNKKGLLTKLLALSMLVFLIGLFVNYVEFKILKLNTYLWPLILYSVIGSLSILLSFTPGAIGIRESLYLLSTGVLMVTSENIIQLAAIDRGISILVLAICFVFLQLVTKNKLQEK